MPDLLLAGPWEVRIIDRDSAFYPAMVDLRKAILRKPLGLDISETDLAAETDQIHFALINRETESVAGCAMLIKKPNGIAKVRQVAVSESLRGNGLGKRLMDAVEDAARLEKFSEIQLHARETAIRFYLEIGYEIIGDSFMEVSLPHVLMKKSIV